MSNLQKLRPLRKRLGSIITSIWHPLITGPVMCTTLATQRSIDTIWTPELEAKNISTCGNGTGWSSCEEWCLSTVSNKKISWCSADEQLMSGWWAADELLMSSWWVADEQLMSSWWAADEGLMSSWWAADERLMTSWWVNDKWLMIGWLSAAFEQVMSSH